MGGTTFMNRGAGESPQEAFRKLVEDARHEHGHGGYTGTIAEKDSFVTITPPFTPDPTPEGVQAVADFAQGLLDNSDPRVDDKWGPAGHIQLTENQHLFFGWASE